MMNNSGGSTLGHTFSSKKASSNAPIKMDIRTIMKENKRSPGLVIDPDSLDEMHLTDLCEIVIDFLSKCAGQIVELDLSAPIQRKPFWEKVYNTGLLSKLAEVSRERQVFEKENGVQSRPFLSQFSNLMHLNFYGLKVDSEFLENNKDAMRKIKSLTLKNCEMDNMVVEPLLQLCSKLVYIDVCPPEVCASPPISLSALPSSLKFASFNFDNLQGFPYGDLRDNLENRWSSLRAVFTFYHNSPDAEYDHFGKVSEFYEAFLQCYPKVEVNFDCYNVYDSQDFCKTLMILGNALRFLRITAYKKTGDFEINDELLNLISEECKNLEYFGVLVKDSFTKEGLLKLASLPKLSVLELYDNSALDDQIVEIIAKKGGLKVVTLTKNSLLTEQSLYFLLKYCKQLETINLREFHLSEQDANKLFAFACNLGQRQKIVDIVVQSVAVAREASCGIHIQPFAVKGYPVHFIKRLMDYYIYQREGPIF